MLKDLIKGGNPSDKTHFVWNMIGSTIYASTSLILTFLTIRFVGEANGGIFSIALTLAQMYVYIVYYETRNYQVTDAKDSFDFGDYHALKIINCFVMALLVVVYVAIRKYALEKAVIVVLVCIYRMLDGYADVYESEFHKRGRLELAGKSMAFRSIISVTAYLIILYYSGNVIRAIIGAIVLGITGLLLFDVWIFDSVGCVCIRFRKEKLIELYRECFPLFLGMFLWTYILSASRIAVDRVLPSEFQSYYQVLFLPVSVINLFAGFVIRPSLLSLTELHLHGSKRLFWKKILKMASSIMLITIICIIGAYLCGIPILELLSKCDLSSYRSVFVLLICAGGINAEAYLMYYVLTIFRAGNAIIVGYGMASVVAFVISERLTKEFALMGAAVSYLISVIVLLLIFVVDLKVAETIMKKQST